MFQSTNQIKPPAIAAHGEASGTPAASGPNVESGWSSRSGTCCPQRTAEGETRVKLKHWCLGKQEWLQASFNKHRESSDLGSVHP